MGDGSARQPLDEASLRCLLVAHGRGCELRLFYFLSFFPFFLYHALSMNPEPYDGFSIASLKTVMTPPV